MNSFHLHYPAEAAALEAALQQEISTAVDTYLQLPPPSSEDLFDYLYAELPEDLARQKAAWLAGAKP